MLTGSQVTLLLRENQQRGLVNVTVTINVVHQCQVSIVARQVLHLQQHPPANYFTLAESADVTRSTDSRYHSIAQQSIDDVTNT